MSYTSRSYDNEWGQPVVVLVVDGTHDVSRLVSLFNGGVYLIDHISVGQEMARHVRATPGGRTALEALAKDGGPDLTAGKES